MSLMSNDPTPARGENPLRDYVLQGSAGLVGAAIDIFGRILLQDDVLSVRLRRKVSRREEREKTRKTVIIIFFFQ